MNRKEIIATHQSMVNTLSIGRIMPVLSMLRKSIIQNGFDNLLVTLDNLENTYKLVLDYAIKGVEDPQRPVIKKQLIKSLLALNDSLKLRLLDALPSVVYSDKRRVIAQGKILRDRFEDMQSETGIDDALAELLNDMPIESSDAVNEDQQLYSDLFYYAWFKDAYTKEDSDFLQSFVMGGHAPLWLKSLIVSAISLGLLTNFDIAKLKLLSLIALSGQKQVKERAFTGFMFALYLYDRYREYYSEIDQMLKKMSEDDGIKTALSFFLIQVIKAKDTEKFTRKMREEIIPDIVKHAPGIQERLELDNILPEDVDDEKNPRWQKILEESPDLMRKLEELSKLQLEGMDVFMSTFAMLKNFPFFNAVPNWLMLFNKENSEVEMVLNNEEPSFKETFLAALEKSGHICNSDKYSFCFNIRALPDAQKKMMLQMFKAELDNVNEVLNEDERTNPAFQSKIIFTQYIQDLYRFFKLHPQKNEFQDIFNLPLNFHNCGFFKTYFASEELLIKLVDFYFDNSHFGEAINIYNMLIDKGLNTQVVFEKLGFAYQQIKDYENALSAYKKAELFDATTWIYIKIAYCYTRLKQHDKAIKYYQEAERLEPDNIKIQLYIANAYFNSGDIQTALNHYYKLELLAQDNIKVLRPIAWCLFILKRPEEAAPYFEALINSTDLNQFDWMNYGHWQWCRGHIDKAADAYINSIKHKGHTFAAFSKSFRSDEKYLTDYGISREDITLMLDYLLLKTERS